jgi:hypothetical protein
MSEPSLIDRERTLLANLSGLAAEKARVEPDLGRSNRAELERAQRDYTQARDALLRHNTAEKERLEREYRVGKERIDARAVTDKDTAYKEHKKGRWELGNKLDTEQEEAETGFQEAGWGNDAAREGATNDARTKLREQTAQLTAQMEELQAQGETAHMLVEGWNQPAEEMQQAARKKARAAGAARESISEHTTEVKVLLDKLQRLIITQWKGARLFGVVVLCWLVLMLPLGWLLAWLLKFEIDIRSILALGAGGSFVVVGVGGLIADSILRSIESKQVRELYLPLCVVLFQAESTRDHLAERYQSEHDSTILNAKKRHAREQAQLHDRRQQRLWEIAQRRSTGLAEIDQRLQAQLEASEKCWADDHVAGEQTYRQGLARLEQQVQTDQQRLDAQHQSRVDDIKTRHQREWDRRVATWQTTLADARKSIAEINAESDERFPAWDALRPERPAPLSLPALRIGTLQGRCESIVEIKPWIEPRPAPTPIDFTLPALSAFPELTSLFFHARDDGRDRALDALRVAMFRLLTTLPPGRVRFVIVDPVGLGQNFAAFMNLADYDESLVGSRIWTEAPHIEQRLADLTAHMENVIQKYLRNRYTTISEYNAEAGEVAEPFRVLVVANFPANFTTEASRRLISIAQSGPRCGVSTLISIDSKLALPRGFELGDLERCGENLVWEEQEQRFQWRDKDFGPYPLTIDALPDDAFCNRVLHQIGERARDAHRVEVPFEFITPPVEQWWTGSARLGISVPLGRAGATRRQPLELGRGTSQHALIAGKTGSGKSTLLHALITNLGLIYSPDEVELYLVDFKKGVEFKTYAVHHFPHARVIAIESEREFGLSVLQRLDTELKTRGEQFRAVEAQDLNAFRQARPEMRMPRILLIVDEFQEFFVEDDRLAQEAARLLDRLVRQGRAFGVHILLGSQTLGGAYSLARSTIDQMAVRIALQCSEADAHLILSDDNSAARLLSRPGEAIYNDANGLVEGNDPFQVVWLSEEQREHYLGQIHDLASRAQKKPSPVVFEGNAPANVTKNHLLTRLLTTPPPLAGQPETWLAEDAWLGEAMAIDELTAARFRRQNGSNLVIVGQQPESALAMLVTGVVSLSAHAPVVANGISSTLSRIFFVDGHSADPPRTGVLALLPEVVRTGGWRDLPAIMTELVGELERRQSSPGEVAPSLYLVLHGLQRMRDLRRQEDDFGYSSRDEAKPTTPDKQLATLLREGAALGIHTLIWCDTLANLQRALDRASMRELAMRVVFQMNVSDSSNLIDNPAASKLGLHRAYFSNEEDGKLEKFRPYDLPSEEWLAWVREQLRQRGSDRAVPQPSGSG